MHIESYSDEIFYFKHIISEPNRLVQLIEDTETDDSITSVIPKWVPWGASNMPDHIYGYQKRVTIENIETLSGLTQQRARYISNSILRSMRQVANEVKKIKNIEGDLNISDQFGINKYKTGAYMGPHADQYDGNMTLKYSMVAYLNDDYVGGELEFPNQNVKIKPEAGSIVIFPSSVPYLHKSNEIISGEKYMCPGFWLHDVV